MMPATPPSNWNETMRQGREERILDVSYRHVLEHGYLGLNLKRVAEEVGCSNGTLFNHFKSKEDVLLALTTRSMETRRELFERAKSFRGRTRERLCAIGVADRLFVRRYPGHFKVELLVKANSIWEKASEQRRKIFELREMHCLRTVTDLVEEAVAVGDLDLDDRPAIEVTLAFWSMALGVHCLAAAAEPLRQAAIIEPYEVLARNQQALADGFGWRPLSHEFDYDRTFRRIAEEVFPDAT